MPTESARWDRRALPLGSGNNGTNSFHTLYGVTNRVTNVTNLVTHEKSLTMSHRPQSYSPRSAGEKAEPINRGGGVRRQNFSVSAFAFQCPIIPVSAETS